MDEKKMSHILQTRKKAQKYHSRIVRSGFNVQAFVNKSKCKSHRQRREHYWLPLWYSKDTILDFLGKVFPIASPLAQLNEHIMSYEVYKLLFVRMVEREHVGLFVKTEEDSGFLFHAIGDPASSTSKVLAMQFQMVPCSPWTSPTVLDIKLIGTISKDRFSDLKGLCKATPHPVGPRHSRERPNCWSWFYNVVYDLHHQEIVQFMDTSVIPTQKPPLQALNL